MVVSSNGKEKPKVSVIMPVYNTRRDWLDLAIKSILRQTYRDFELIIIDDGSAAATQQQLSEYRDARIVLLRSEKNTNAAIARNEGLKVAQGEFVAFMDSDDISLPERLERQVEYLKNHPNIGLLASRVANANHPQKAERLLNRKHSKQIECDLLLVCNVFCTSSVIVRRDILRREGIQFCADCFVTQDYKMWLDLVGKTEFAKMDEILAQYREKKPDPRREMQEEIARRVQIEALTRKFGVREDEARMLISFLRGKEIPDDGNRLLAVMNHIIEQLEAGGYGKIYAQRAIRWAIRKVFYRTRTWQGQRRLMRVLRHNTLRPSLFRQLWCLFTKGIL